MAQVPPSMSPAGAGPIPKRKPMAEINVVPYIDVMLVLLVIFMITAPMLNQGIDVDLPDVNAEINQVNADDMQLVVSISKNGLYYIERGKDDPKAIALVDIQNYVSNLLKQQPRTNVLVRGDAEVPYGKVVSLMGVLQQSGAKSVGLITEAPESDK